MQLILVVGKVGMINQICQLLFCWKLILLSAYFAFKMITKYITKYSSNCKVCMYQEYQRLFFSMFACKSSWSTF